MIDVQVKIKNGRKLIDPIEVYGQDYGKVFQQYFDGVPQKDFLISTGGGDRPIDIWWDSEDKQYKLSSSSKKDLTGFVSSVKYREVDAKIEFKADLTK